MRTVRLSTSCGCLLALTFILSDAMKFTLKKGYSLTSGSIPPKRFTERGMTSVRCAVLCSLHNCGSFHFSKTENVCELFFSEVFYIYNSLHLTPDPEWIVGYTVPAIGNDWVLAFRAVKENKVSVWDTWSNSNLQHDNPVSDSFPLACLRMINTGSCDRHFRSQILNNWTNVKEVRFSLIKSDTEVAYALFNGRDTSRDSWFTPGRILSSTWSPEILLKEIAVPTIEGSCDTMAIPHCRRFNWIALRGTCRADILYTITLDAPAEICIARGEWPHAGDVRKFPVFYYAETSAGSSLASDSGYPISGSADALAVWVKFN